MKKYDVAAYVWPAYTGDETRARIFWPEGCGEWETVRDMKPRFEGHKWPRKPLWGYVNEADPYVMEMQIQAAADHGVNVFIYDWYWFDNKPFLEQCLNNGYLKARNNDRVKFYLMWANHTANSMWDRRIAELYAPVWDGAVDRKTFDEIIVKRTIEKYFSHPSYYKIDGMPVFSVYKLDNLVKGLGGTDRTREAIAYFRDEVKKAGFPGLHLQGIYTAFDNYEYDGCYGGEAGNLFNLLDLDSVTHYNMGKCSERNKDYTDIIKDHKKEYDRMDTTDKLYFPQVSVGWDGNPRFRKFQPDIMKNNTPENIKKAFLQAKEYVDTHKLPAPLIVINSWNEWTETSYLQPDNLYGYGYLEAIKDVFVSEE